jgi:hypothetical protein
LREAFRAALLDLAGPRVEFDPNAGCAAAFSLAEACWRLVGESPEAPLPADRLGHPRSAAAHLSADVALRLLPAVYRRAKVRGDDPLAGWVAELLRRWPLSGVLVGLPTGPATPTDFHGHPGLQLLYAERLADHPQPAWVPAAGPTRDRVERAFAARGVPVPTPPAPTEDRS